MRFISPLRYPGGKSKLSKHICSLFETNNYKDGIYIEPFAGGAGIALFLLLNNYVKKIHINDLDPSIYAFWHSLFYDMDKFIDLIRNTPICIEEWNKQREIQQNQSEATTLQLGFSTFYMNRTNISGIIKGGVIGGYKQQGKYKMNARFNKEALIKRIEKLREYKDKVVITNFCVTDLIDQEIKNSKEKTFIYFDPPYYIKGPNLYKNHLSHEDHLTISNKIKSIKNHYWLITYDNIREIEEMYENFRKKTYSLSYSAGKAAKGKELMIFSNNLSLKYKNNSNKKDDNIQIIF
jgi:DNA adenine methylase